MISHDDPYTKARDRIVTGIKSGATELDLSGLVGLTSLPTEISQASTIQMLTLDETDISDLSPLAPMTQLEVLYLNRTPVSDLAPLADLVSLRELWLNKTAVAELSPISALVSLERVSISGTAVVDLAPLQSLTNLQRLDIDDTPVLDLYPILSNTKLSAPDNEYGLTFRSSAAARSDETLSAISRMSEPPSRFRELTRYLTSRSSRERRAFLLPDQENKFAPLYKLDEDGLIKSVDLPLQVLDDDQAELHSELREKADVVTGVLSGTNRFPTLWRAAERYKLIVERDLDDIPLRSLWSSANTLRLALEQHDRASALGNFEFELPPAIHASLLDLLQTHGLFVLGFPEASELERDMRSYLYGPDHGTQKEAINKVGEELIDDRLLAQDDAADLKTDLDAAGSNLASSEMASISSRGRLWNILSVIFRSTHDGGGKFLSFLRKNSVEISVIFASLAAILMALVG